MKLLILLAMAAACSAQTLTQGPGGISIIGLETPGAPSIATVGTAGATTYTYAVVAYSAHGAHTAASVTGSISTGNASLSSANYNLVSWASLKDAVRYEVYCTTGCAVLGLVGSTGGTSYRDTIGVGNGTTPPSTDTTKAFRPGSIIGALLNSAVATDGLTVGAHVLYDDFSRSDQTGLGTPPVGSPWSITGAAAGTAAISGGFYVNPSGTSYATQSFSSPPQRITAGGQFTTSSGGSVIIARYIQLTPSFRMLHLILSQNGQIALSWWETGSTNNIIPCPIATNAIAANTQFEFSSNIVGNSMYIELPGGVSGVCTDSHIGTVPGNGTNVFWEIIDSTSKINKAEVYLAAPTFSFGELQSHSGINNTPIGVQLPSSGYFTDLHATGIVTVPNSIQITGESNPPSGTGMELGYAPGSGFGDIRCYTRTGGPYCPFKLNDWFTMPIADSGSTNKGVCWKADRSLGFCSTVLDSSGNCTCN